MSDITDLLTVTNTPAIATWVADMRNPENLQVQGYLKLRFHGEGQLQSQKGNCCLGLLCETVAKQDNNILHSDFAGFRVHTPRRPIGVYNALPPIEVLPALGIELTIERDIDVFSFRIAFPKDMRFIDYHNTAGEPIVNARWETIQVAQCNDELKLTFDQIADLVEYFGVYAVD